MEYKLKTELEFLEWCAHINAFTPLGTFYWESFKIKEVYFNSKFTEYNRRW